MRAARLTLILHSFRLLSWVHSAVPLSLSGSYLNDGSVDPPASDSNRGHIFGQEHRCLHDHLAGTWVINE